MVDARPSVAALLTCHNRRELTLRCLASLRRQTADVDLRVVLVDDGSTDGTTDAVNVAYPEVEVLAGTGSLYWAGGMRVAQVFAVEKSPDFILWVNDDDLLRETALLELIDSYRRCREASGTEGIVAGAFLEHEGGPISFGGFRRVSRWWPTHFRRVPLSTSPREVDTINGNFVLIPRPVYRALGTIDGAYQHVLGDLDYGLRARQAGFKVWMSPGHAGYCASDQSIKRWEDHESTSVARLRGALATKGLPAAEWKRFTRQHAGWAWPVFFVGPYLRVMLSPLRPRRRLRSSPG